MFRDYLQLHFIIILWGFTAISGVWLTLPPAVVVLYRTIIAALGMAVLLRAKRVKLPTDPRTILPMLLTGILVSAHWFLFFAAARVANVSICLVGLASAAFWTALLEPLMSRTRWRWYELLLSFIMVAAMYAIAHVEQNEAYLWGLLMGVASALCTSLFTIINGRFTHHTHHYTITFVEMVGAILTTALYIPISLLFDPSPIAFLPDTQINAWAYLTDGANLFFLGIVCTVYAYASSVELMRRIPPFSVNLSVNLEPVYGILLAALFFSEWKEMTGTFYLSASIILACVLAYPVLKRWDDRRKTA